MSQEPDTRRTRAIVNVWRRAATNEELERHEHFRAEHPETDYLPIDAVWGWNVDVVDDPEDVEEAASRGMRTRSNEGAPRIISSIRKLISTELALRFRRPVVPLDPRLRKLLGTTRTAGDQEVAASAAALLGLNEPTSHASQELLVLMVLIAQGWYDDPWAAYDELDLGHEIMSGIRARMPSADFDTALKELGVEDDIALCYVAAKFVNEEMGFKALWGGS